MLILDDFVSAQASVKPSQVVEFHTHVKPVKWDEVAGFVELKEALLKQLVWPITHPATFRKLGLSAPAGLLLSSFSLFALSPSSSYFLFQEFCCTENLAAVKHT